MAAANRNNPDDPRRHRDDPEMRLHRLEGFVELIGTKWFAAEWSKYTKDYDAALNDHGGDHDKAVLSKRYGRLSNPID